MIGMSPMAGALATPEKRESESDYALGQIADGVDRIEKNGVTDGQYDRARELLKRLRTCLQDQE